MSCRIWHRHPRPHRASCSSTAPPCFFADELLDVMAGPALRPDANFPVVDTGISGQEKLALDLVNVRGDTFHILGDLLAGLDVAKISDIHADLLAVDLY